MKGSVKMELKGSKTEQNLMTAFAGESQARNKYSYYASKAKKDGFVQIAELFEETANNEKEHAKIWFKLLHDGIQSTEINLEDAAAGENYEWTEMYAEFAKEIFDLGFPQAYHTDNSVLTFMKGAFGKNFSDKELTDILSGGVYADTLAVEYLNSRGFSALTGCKRGKQIPTDATEIYTNDDINDGIIKGKRNCRQTFNLGDSFEVIATANQIKKLTSLVDYHDKVLADCAFGVYENECGGRIAVSGYYPFTWLSDFYKFTQLKNLFRYLSDNKLPSYVDSLLRIRNHTFIDGQKTVVALLNSSNQLYENVILAIKGDKNKVEVFDAKGVINEVDRHKFDGHYSFFNITEILPYNIIVVEG